MTRKMFAEGRGYSRQDWDEAEADRDATDAELRNAKPFDLALPELAASARRVRGPQRKPIKTLVSLRLSPDVLERFKAGGPGWQRRIDDALRKIVGL